MDYLPRLLNGLAVTAQVACGGILFAVIFGLGIGIASAAQRRILRYPARCWIEIFRGTSALVQLYWFFYVLPQLLGIELPALLTGMLVLGLNISAYLAEVVRGALATVPRGQHEAATALGLNATNSLWRVALPQAIPMMLPPWGNLVIELTKGSALILFIGLSDTMAAGRALTATQPQDAMLIYVLVAALYGALCLLLVGPVKFMERASIQRAIGSALLSTTRPLSAMMHRSPAWLLHTLLAGLAGLGLVALGFLSVRFVAIWDGVFALQIMPALISGMWTSLLATAGGAVLALVLGLVAAGLRGVAYIGRPLGWVLAAIRATPLLVQLFLLFYGVLPALNISAPPLLVGILALGIHYATYTAEVYRAGIAGVPHGQLEAARALGLSRAATFVRIIVPQAVPRSVPALGNYVVAMLKETPLLSAISVVELFGRAEEVMSDHFRGIEAFTLVGLLFLALSLLASAGIRLTERLLPVRHA